MLIENQEFHEKLKDEESNIVEAMLKCSLD